MRASTTRPERSASPAGHDGAGGAGPDSVTRSQPSTCAVEQRAAQPRRAQGTAFGRGNVDTEPRARQGRYRPTSACSGGFYRATPARSHSICRTDGRGTAVPRPRRPRGIPGAVANGRDANDPPTAAASTGDSPLPTAPPRWRRLRRRPKRQSRTDGTSAVEQTADQPQRAAGKMVSRSGGYAGGLAERKDRALFVGLQRRVLPHLRHPRPLQPHRHPDRDRVVRVEVEPERVGRPPLARRGMSRRSSRPPGPRTAPDSPRPGRERGAGSDIRETTASGRPSFRSRAIISSTACIPLNGP